MALDVYVMPLWRFKVGDFSSPIEAATGLRPRTITADGVSMRPRQTGWLDRWRARRQVAAIRKAVEAVNHAPIRWNDEGNVVYAEQSWGLEALKAYAKWLDCRDHFPEFSPPPEGDYDKHPVLSVPVSRLSYPQLIGHDFYNGYFLPCEFSQLVDVEPYMIFGRWPASRSVGSTPALIRELDAVQTQLRTPDGYDYPKDDPLLRVRSAYLQLREIAELSSRHGLPVIFWG